MSDTSAPTNVILASLPQANWNQIKSNLRDVPLIYGDILLHADEPIHQVYFPTAGVVSAVALFESGASVEMATIGTEGVVGIGAVLGSHVAVSRKVVQVPGRGLRACFGIQRVDRAECPCVQAVNNQRLKVQPAPIKIP